MSYQKQRPILVTGSHRSGSTWVGKMLSLPKEVKYISEPFNPTVGLKAIKQWFLYINPQNQDQYRSAIENLLKFRGNIPLNLPALKYWLNALPFGDRRPLVKDPIACFSADWLAENFDFQTVVLLRHPAAFYLSLKRVNWHFDFNNFLNQEQLMSDHLECFRPLIEKSDKTFVEEAGVLWLCIYFVLDKYLKKNADWIMIRHEDLSADPAGEYEKLYQKLNLNFTPATRTEIEKSSGGHNQTEAKVGRELDLSRNSRALAKNWKTHLSQEEIEKIKEITQSISQIYYSDQDW